MYFIIFIEITQGSLQKCFIGVARCVHLRSWGDTPKPTAITEFQEFYNAFLVVELKPPPHQKPKVKELPREYFGIFYLMLPII